MLIKPQKRCSKNCYFTLQITATKLPNTCKIECEKFSQFSDELTIKMHRRKKQYCMDFGFENNSSDCFRKHLRKIQCFGRRLINPNFLQEEFYMNRS